ncbi:MAG: SIS domain-containing protein [Rhodothermales bacterium]|nr:SIS domain-containing protein [Rhodothermales bacterium]
MTDTVRGYSAGDDAISWIKRQLDDAAAVHDAIRADVENLAAIATSIAGSLQNGGRVFFFGNGGSAADAQHWAAELSGRYYIDRPSLPAIALTTNSSQLTAIGNDYGFADVFARPLSGLATDGDVAVAISTSGTSENVLRAIDVAAKSGLTTIGFTGSGDNPMAGRCDFVVTIPSTDVARVQEGHEVCAHIIWSLVEQEIFGDQRTR